VGTSDRPVIVLGCPRSGTTMLQVMLHSHPRLAIAPETRFILPAYRQRLRFGDLEDPANRRALGEFVAAGRYFRNLGLDPAETVERIVEGPPTFGSAIGIVLRSYAERFGRPRWGEKRPGYYRHIDVVMRLFPDAQLVHIVRDPRDCVASLKRVPWWKRTSHHSVLAWARAIDLTAEAARRWPVTRVQYERLVAEPERELRSLCAALDEEYDPAMAEPERFVTEVVPDKRWHRSTREGAATTARIGRWRGHLEPWELQLCETVLGRRMEQLGYALTGAGRPPAAYLARYAYVRATREGYRRVEQAQDRWRQRSEPNPVAARLTSGQLVAAGV
jgi:Sulfotransferase family